MFSLLWSWYFVEINSFDARRPIIGPTLCWSVLDSDCYGNIVIVSVIDIYYIYIHILSNTFQKNIADYCNQKLGIYLAHIARIQLWRRHYQICVLFNAPSAHPRWLQKCTTCRQQTVFHWCQACLMTCHALLKHPSWWYRTRDSMTLCRYILIAQMSLMATPRIWILCAADIKKWRQHCHCH
jgi:hypothetical protein